MIDPRDIKTHVLAAGEIIKRMPVDDARTFCAVVQELAKIRGITNATALKVARESMPSGYYRAFCRAQERHQAPELFPHRDEYQSRRLAAIRRGCII